MMNVHKVQGGLGFSDENLVDGFDFTYVWRPRIDGEAIKFENVNSKHRWPSGRQLLNIFSKKHAVADDFLMPWLQHGAPLFPENFDAESDSDSSWSDSSSSKSQRRRGYKTYDKCGFVNTALMAFRCKSRQEVEEKFGEQNFRVFSEMRRKFWYIDPPKSKFWVEI